MSLKVARGGASGARDTARSAAYKHEAAVLADSFAASRELFSLFRSLFIHAGICTIVGDRTREGGQSWSGSSLQFLTS